MKSRGIVYIVALLLVLPITTAWAAKDGEKGASTMARQKASDKAIFNRVGDWFATVGKSDVEKEAIIAERDAKRAAKKAEKKAKKMMGDAEGDAKEAADKAKKKMKKMEGDMDKKGKDWKKKMKGSDKKGS